jgi:hypothetical protein
MNSKEVAETGLIAPRAKSFAQLSDKSKRIVSSVMASIAVKIAQILLPQDYPQGHTLLLEEMMENSLFQ